METNDKNDFQHANLLEVKDIELSDDNCVMILPESVANDGTGYYALESMDSYKELKALGIPVKYYTEKRKWIDRRSADPPIVIDIVIGIGVNLVSNAIYDYLKKKAKPKSIVKSRIVIVTRSKKSISTQEYTHNGSLNDTFAMIDKIQELHNDKNS